MLKLPFYIVDVFARSPYSGNQLAVFLQAGPLLPDQMLRIAQEIGFAESAFITSEQLSQGAVAIRIFTVEYEVPFAGHPTLGSAFVVQQFMAQESISTLNLITQAGTIPVSFTYSGSEPSFLFMRQMGPLFGQPIPKTEVGVVTGLAMDAFHPTFPVQEVSTGLPFLIIPVQRLSDMRRISLSPASLENFLKKHGLLKSQRADQVTVALFFFCPETYQHQHALNARMLALENGKIIEDAATGSANGCLLAYLLKHRFYPEPEIDLEVEQGYEIGRNATIRLKGSLSPDQEFELNVGGQVQLIATGEWIHR